MIAPGLDGTGRCTADTFAGTCLVADAWSASEFTGDDQQDAAIQATVVDVFDQGSHGLVHELESILDGFEAVRVDGMVVPVANATAKTSGELRGDQVDA